MSEIWVVGGTVYLYVDSQMVFMCCHIETAQRWALEQHGLVSVPVKTRVED